MNLGFGIWDLGFRPALAWTLITVTACAIISLFVSFQLGMFMLFFALVVWWVWEYPEEGFLLFLITAPLLPMFKYTQTIGTITLVKDVIILTLFAKLFAWPLVNKQLPYRRNILFAPLVALSIWTAIALLRADSLLVGILRAREIALYALFYLAVLYLNHDQPTMLRRLKWFLVSLGLVLLHALYQYWFAADSAVLRFDPARSVWISRFSSTFGHPSVFGHYLLLASALFGSLSLYLNNRWRLSALVGFITLLPFVYLTYSRAVWLGWGVMMIIIVGARLIAPKNQGSMNRTPTRIIIPSLVIIILVFISLLFTPAGKFLRSTLNTSYASNQERLEFLARLIAPMTNIDALLGRGLGDVTAQNFRQVDLETIDIASGQSRNIQLAKNSTLVDNQYLKTFVEMGMIGILIYLWLYWRVIKSSFSLITNYRLLIPRAIGLLSLAFLTAFIVQAFFVDIWDVFPSNAYFWALAAILSSYNSTFQKSV